MNKIFIIVVLWTFLNQISLSFQERLQNKVLPQVCTEPAHTKANNCARETAYRYIPEYDTCTPITDKHCRGYNRFTMYSECIWRCSGLPETYKELQSNKTIIGVPKESEEKSQSEIILEVFKELHSSCKDRPSNCWKSTNAYKYDQKTKQCLPVTDSKCRGANRFTMKEECEFVCIYDKGKILKKRS